jgi:hypothetical protein
MRRIINAHVVGIAAKCDLPGRRELCTLK